MINLLSPTNIFQFYLLKLTLMYWIIIAFKKTIEKWEKANNNLIIIIAHFQKKFKKTLFASVNFSLFEGKVLSNKPIPPDSG